MFPVWKNSSYLKVQWIISNNTIRKKTRKILRLFCCLIYDEDKILRHVFLYDILK